MCMGFCAAAGTPRIAALAASKISFIGYAPAYGPACDLAPAGPVATVRLAAVQQRIYIGTMTSTNDIRRGFLDYFERNGHARVPSAPLVPQNDPTLMFVNAGMVPFKNVFTGLETRPYKTAASSQKSVRAGGKHNDLDNVGYTARHHTFFEMLGNFSFGDYFKDRAIELAWNLLTREWGLSPDRLTATVYHTDDEAFDLWKKISGLPESRIIRIPTKDNFWAMGDDGPCGPCSEIFYDHGDHIPGGPPGSPDEDGDRFVEIWNLVFMQYEQEANEIVRDLPRPSIDTGMGLERVSTVLQGVHNVFDTTTLRELIEASAALTGTEDALRAQGFAVDRAGFDAAMAEQKAQARAAWKGSGEKASADVWFDIAEELGSTEFTGYAGHEGEGVVLALVRDGQRVERADAGDKVVILTNQTPFYAESGGQMGDTGSISSDKGLRADVEDTSKPLGRLHAHQAVIREGEVAVGDAVHLAVDVERRGRVRANHSATHLLHAALRHRLGGHVTQKGSLVAPDRLRFDFSHPKALTAEDIAAVEEEVNRHIRENDEVTTRLMTPDEAS